MHSMIEGHLKLPICFMGVGMNRFGAEETNTVMREFEKCGPIVNHISGPGGANWVHLQYQVPNLFYRV